MVVEWLLTVNVKEMTVKLACSKGSGSGERCEVKKAMKSRGGLLSSSHRSPLSERLEQATVKSIGNARSM